MGAKLEFFRSIQARLRQFIAVLMNALGLIAVKARIFQARLRYFLRRGGNSVPYPRAGDHFGWYLLPFELSCIWIVPIRKGYMRHDPEFTPIKNPEEWRDNGQNIRAEETPVAGIHLAPDGIRFIYLLFALFWLVAFGIIGPKFQKITEVQQPINAATESENP